MPCRVGWHRTSAGCPSPEPRATAHLQGAPKLHVYDKGTVGAAMWAASSGAKGLGLQARGLAPRSCQTHQHATCFLHAPSACPAVTYAPNSRRAMLSINGPSRAPHGDRQQGANIHAKTPPSLLHMQAHAVRLLDPPRWTCTSCRMTPETDGSPSAQRASRNPKDSWPRCQRGSIPAPG